MPEFPIVDAHVHLWDPHTHRISWLDGDATLMRRYDLADYAEHTAGIAIEALVYLEVNVDPAYALIEARHIAELMANEPRLQAIVAYAPLEDGAPIRSYLRALTAISPAIRGVRRVVQGEPDPAFCLRPRFIEAVQILPEFGLSCDICIKHHQLAATIELVRQCPDTLFILDHIGKPDIAAGLLDPWREQINQLAELPNVWCKISGIVTEANHQTWQAHQLQPYILHVVKAFGTSRIIFGGDWPVALLASSYRRWVETLENITGHLSGAQQQALWAGNAKRFYRL